MDEKRLQKYLELIEKLINSSSDEELVKILTDNLKLLDANFVQMLEAVAQTKSDDGDEDTANFLRDLANTLKEALKSPPTVDIKQSLKSLKEAEFHPYGQFLAEVLQATYESEGDAQVVYPLLEANIDKLDANLPEVLRRWAVSIFKEAEAKEAISIGFAIGNFSVFIEQFPLGNKASNMEIAITGNEVILTFFTKDKYDEIWALTQNNLGNNYIHRIKGNKADNIEKAIAFFEAALGVYTRNDYPYEWARAQNNLGVAYRERIEEDKADNIEKAIAACNAALEIRTREHFPKDWADTQNNLGAAYFDRIEGDKAENIEKAIAAYNAALEVRTRKHFPKDWADTQNNLGLAYRNRIKDDKANNIEKAIAAYNAALKVSTRNGFPYEWAKTQNNLGLAYNDRIKKDKADNIEKAIAAYNAALEVYTRNDFPYEWAMTQNNLGAAYSDRIKGDKADNIEKAIVAYNTALEIRTRKHFPKDWADTQNNLGNAYTTRIKGDKAQNIEKAIAFFKAALEIRTRNKFRQDWALTQNNLGNAYRERIKGDKAQNIENAIAAYNAALEIRTRNKFPQDWAGTQINLGGAYSERIKGDKAENIEKAIAACNGALKVYTRKDFPQNWAMTQNNLGNAYFDRIKGDKANNIEKAIVAYNAALEVRTSKDFPQDWAMTQNNLGFAYSKRIKGDKTENIENAIAAYNAALEVCTRNDFPQENTLTLYNLGLAYQDAKRFNEAYTTFEQAIETVESLRDEILSGDESKRKQAEKWNNLYRFMVEICLELKEDTQAIEYAERSKTRNLVELILERDLKTIFPPEVVTKLEQLRDQIATGQYQIQNGTAEDLTALAQHLQQLRKQRNELQDRYLPVGYSFKFNKFKTTLDESTVIIEWYIINHKILAFIIKPTGEITIWQSEPEDEEAFGDWVTQYLQNYYIQKDQWRNSLEEELKKLASILHIDEILDQIPKDCDREAHALWAYRLILIPHQYLHLFPLHALPVTTKNSQNPFCLLDLFNGGVSYAPSCQILQQVQQRQRPDFESLFAIKNPTEDLDFADLEVENILPYFTSHKVLSKEQATKAALFEATLELKEINYLHFSCHGYFNLESPQNSFVQLAGTDVSPTPANANPEKYLITSDGKVIDLSKCLTLGNLFEQKLDFNQTRLVVLSACETGLIDFNNTSDEYISLPSGFLYAGSSSVVSSLWTVNDQSTAYLMIKFLQNLKESQDVSVVVALNQAQNWLRNITWKDLQEWVNALQLDSKNNSRTEDSMREIVPKDAPINKKIDEKPFHSPFHWAGFTAIGN